MSRLAKPHTLVPLALVVASALAAGGCADSSAKLSGEACVASSECELGLVCDFRAEPPVCAATQTTVPDAASGDVDAAAEPVDAELEIPDAVAAEPDAEVEDPDADVEDPDADVEDPDADVEDPDADNGEPDFDD